MFSLIPWRERRELSTLRREMDRLFDRFFEGWPLRLFEEEGGFWPTMDVAETSKEIIVRAEIPGIDPKELDISLHDGVLTIRGERKQEKKEEDETYHLVERSYGSFTRSFRLPAEVDMDKVKASYKNGVLEINMPKMKAEPVKKIEVKVA
jgi:HSP20 family protein